MVKRRGINFSHGAALFAIASIFVIVGARWIWVYRHGRLLDIDEAGYLGIALNDYSAFVRGGLIGWLSALEAPGIQAPLTTAVASLIFVLAGPHVIAGFFVPLSAALGCIVLTYFLGKSVSCPRVGLLASILVASCPVILNFSRSFQFSMSATFIMTLCLFAIVKSERFQNAGWTTVFGLSLGFLPLARTMTIAFVPGVAMAAFLYVIGEPSRRLQSLLMLAGALLLAGVTTATWLAPHVKDVFEYLYKFGYGAQAAEYGAEQSKFGPDAWLGMLDGLTNEVFLPHFLVILLGGLAMCVIALRDSLKSSNADFFHKVIRSPTIPIIIVVMETLLALTSTRNSGSAFFAPIIPALMVAAVWAGLRVSHCRWYRLTLTVFVISVGVVASAPLLDLHTPVSPPWTADVPILGRVIVTDGRGTLQRYEGEVVGGAGCDACSKLASVTEPMDQALQQEWFNVSKRTADMINHRSGANAVVAWGFRHRLYNVNTVNLQELLSKGIPFWGRQIEPTVTGESLEGYLWWMTREVMDACVLLTSDTIVDGDFLPAVNRAFMHEAAEEVGLVQEQHLSTPDGQTVTLWKHKIDPPNCR
jgi:4-amino-4-deoxy-L-arabinose transferase-like glycosyltransferase